MGNTAISLLTAQNSKCQVLTKFSFSMERRVKVFLATQNEQKFSQTLEGLASQIVSHTLRVWKLISEYKRKFHITIPVLRNFITSSLHRGKTFDKEPK